MTEGEKDFQVRAGGLTEDFPALYEWREKMQIFLNFPGRALYAPVLPPFGSV